MNKPAFASHSPRTASVSQIAATFPEKGAASIRKLYLNAITNANKYVFILNQYFRDLDLTDEIITAYKKRGIINKKSIPFVVVSNSFEGVFAQEGHDTAVLRKFAKAKIPIHYCRMVTNSAIERKDIYIHAKVLIVDDVFYTVGSANFNDRSLRSDPELNIGVVDPSQAKEPWRDLWNIVIGKPIDEIVQNPDEGARSWLQCLAENDERLKANQNLKNGCAITFEPTGWRGIWPTKMGHGTCDFINEDCLNALFPKLFIHRIYCRKIYAVRCPSIRCSLPLWLLSRPKAKPELRV